MYCIVLCFKIQITAVHLTDCQEDTYLSLIGSYPTSLSYQQGPPLFLKTPFQQHSGGFKHYLDNENVDKLRRVLAKRSYR